MAKSTPTLLRRTLLQGAAAGAVVAALPLCQAAGYRSPPAPTRTKKALFVFGGWEGHEPSKVRDIFVPFLRKNGFDVTVSDTLDSYTDAALMKTLDLIVQVWTMGTIKKGSLQGLLDAVRNGTGLAGWHGGLADSFRQETEYQFMVGGQWVAHPGNVIDYDVRISDKADPITAGITDFHVKSEQYYMHIDPNNKVLATTTFNGKHAAWIDGAVMPVIWKKIYGKGRVFFSSMGHSASVFDAPEPLTLTGRGLLWAAEGKGALTPNLVTPVYPGG